nr:uncharacterized protein LOC129050814 isoform X1 [Pongo abelii]
MYEGQTDQDTKPAPHMEQELSQPAPSKDGAQGPPRQERGKHLAGRKLCLSPPPPKASICPVTRNERDEQMKDKNTESGPMTYARGLGCLLQLASRAPRMAMVFAGPAAKTQPESSHEGDCAQGRTLEPEDGALPELARIPGPRLSRGHGKPSPLPGGTQAKDSRQREPVRRHREREGRHEEVFHPENITCHSHRKMPKAGGRATCKE